MITLVALFLYGTTSEKVVDPGYKTMTACVAAGEALKRQHSKFWNVSFSCLRK